MAYSPMFVVRRYLFRFFPNSIRTECVRARNTAHTHAHLIFPFISFELHGLMYTILGIWLFGIERAHCILFSYLIRVWFDTKIKHKPIYFFWNIFFSPFLLYIFPRFGNKALRTKCFYCRTLRIDFIKWKQRNETHKKKGTKNINECAIWTNSQSVQTFTFDCFVWLYVWFVCIYLAKRSEYHLSFRCDPCRLCEPYCFAKVIMLTVSLLQLDTIIKN